jgi:hypothetical protein
MVQNEPFDIIFTATHTGLTWTAYVQHRSDTLGVATGTWGAASGSTYTFHASQADTNSTEVYFLFVSNTGERYTTGVISTYPSPLTAAQGWTLAEIIGKAQSRCDQLVFQNLGKFSQDWWIELVNSVQMVIASEVGYKRTPLPVSVIANTQISPLPVGMCKNIREVWIGNKQIDVTTDFALTEKTRGWRQISSLPNQPRGGSIQVSSSNAADNGVSVTVTGTTTAGLYQTETHTIPFTDTLAWGQILTMTVATACVGIVTIAESPSGEVIATIPAGQLSVGNASCVSSGIVYANDGIPSFVVLDPPNMCWWPIPTQNWTATVYTSSMPADMVNMSDMPDSFPVAYQDVLWDGAAALAEIADLYSTSQQERVSILVQKTRLKGLAEFIGSMSADRQEPVGISPEGNYQERFNRRRR